MRPSTKMPRNYLPRWSTKRNIFNSVQLRSSNVQLPFDNYLVIAGWEYKVCSRGCLNEARLWDNVLGDNWKAQSQGFVRCLTTNGGSRIVRLLIDICLSFGKGGETRSEGRLFRPGESSRPFFESPSSTPSLPLARIQSWWRVPRP